jgi:hypothetical protein
LESNVNQQEWAATPDPSITEKLKGNANMRKSLYVTNV